MVSSGLNTGTNTGLALSQPRHFLALNLPRWATDCWKRRNPAFAGLSAPFVLYERQKGAFRLAALDERAELHGLRQGQSLADARALVPGLVGAQIDHDLVAAIFADFADWHSYASPIVARLDHMAPYGDLVLDITGVSHLFGGQANMLALIVNKLRGLGFTAQGAIAPSVGAAFALARYRPGLVVETDCADALAGLPVRALRLEEPQIAGLVQMGLKRIGQLYGRDRKSLQARFGASLILRLDQALGHIEERLDARLPQIACYSEQRFAEPIGLIDDVLMCVRDLAIRLCLQLADQGRGAQHFHLLLYRVDHKVMRFAVNAARATRDPDHVARLFANRAEKLGDQFDAGFGIDVIRLGAEDMADLPESQIGAFETRDGAEDLDRLYDRITARLGAQTIRRSQLADSHVPERAVILQSAMTPATDAPLAHPDPARPRPLRLLPEPEPVSVLAQVPHGPPASMIWRRVTYRFVRASGPERLAFQWWHTRQTLERTRLNADEKPAPIPQGTPLYREGAASRDYYLAEDDAGRRFWLFRLGLYGYQPAPIWFLHGFFP